MGRQRTSSRSWPIAAAVAAGLFLAACSTPANGPGASGGVDTTVPTGSVTTGTVATEAAGIDGDPNAAGRALATASPLPPSGAADGATAGGGAAGGGAAGGGAAGICANETLTDSMTRAVDNGASVVLATGAFTGMVLQGDGEIGVPYSEVALTDGTTLAGADVATPVSVWVSGDLSAAADSSTTGETSSLWARGGRLIAVVDPASGGSGLPGAVVRVAPVVGDDVIMGWVGCWTTQGVPSRDFDGAVELFDDRGLHPTEMQLSAVGLDDFRSALPTG